MQKTQAPSRSLSRRSLYPLLAIMLGILVALTLAELLMRSMGGPLLADAPQIVRIPTTDAPQYARTYQPVSGPLAYIRHPDHPAYHPLGVYGRTTTLVPPPDVFRILVLGDSVAEQAQGNPDGFTTVLAEELTRQTGGTVEVLNAGVGGYNSRQQAEWLKERGLQFHPRLVLVAFVNNDLAAPQQFRQRDGCLESVYRQWRKIPVVFDPGGLAGPLLTHSQLARGLFLGLAALRFRLDPHWDPVWFDPEAAENLAGLEMIRQLCQQSDCKLALLHFPILKDFSRYESGPWWAVHQRVATFCQAHGIPRLDLRNALAEIPEHERYGPDELRFNQLPIHPSRRGHRRAGEAVARFCLARGLVPLARNSAAPVPEGGDRP